MLISTLVKHIKGGVNTSTPLCHMHEKSESR